ncbi:hypothetical protein [Uliginosibacterium sp. TH139]|uniref:hypothetical protein n=1 Tax=Uliginosibacterium sp. TH139 TaxID=2067453 RepID=UPI00117CB161|nr:hypothetical protein [Uliginosibacterium sp. TH139]
MLHIYSHTVICPKDINLTNTKLTYLLALALCLTACKSREEEIAAEHAKGTALVEDKAARVKGIGEALQSDGQKAAAELSTGVGKVIGGVTQGIDRAKEAKITTDDGAAKLGVSSDRAVLEVNGKEGQNTLKAYVKSAQAFKGSLHLRGFDNNNREVGRSAKEERSLAADDAEYVAFTFDSATPMNRVEKWVLFAAAK